MKVALATYVFVILCNCWVYSKLNVDDACQLDDGTPGFCKSLSMCSVRSSKRCGYWKGERIICCTSPVSLPSEVSRVVAIEATTTTTIKPMFAQTVASEQLTPLPNAPKASVPMEEPIDYSDSTASSSVEEGVIRLSPIIQNNAGTSSGSKKSWRNCDLYSREGYEIQRLKIGGEIKTLMSPRCSKVQTVVGVQKALPKEFPHMAALGAGKRTAINWVCGASLISERFVLTAAHCIGKGNRTLTWVRLGDLNLVTINDEAQPETIAVEATFRHPEYKGSENYYDIGLVKLSRNVVFTAFIRPACLNTVMSEAPDSKVIASGFSKDNSRGSQSVNDLMKAELKIKPAETCADLYMHLNTSKLQNGIAKHMICAGVTQNDVCLGSIKGQIHIKLRGCMYSIVGVWSFGRVRCDVDNTSAVYTRVASFLPWIEEIVWP